MKAPTFASAPAEAVRGVLSHTINQSINQSINQYIYIYIYIYNAQTLSLFTPQTLHRDILRKQKPQTWHHVFLPTYGRAEADDAQRLKLRLQGLAQLLAIFRVFEDMRSVRKPWVGALPGLRLKLLGTVVALRGFGT